MPGRSKEELVALIRELMELTELDEGGPQSFRVRAYENAAVELKSYAGDLAALTESQLCKLDGVGKSTAKKIREYFETGTIAKLEGLRAKYPPSFVELARIPGLGPKTLARLRAELGVESLDDLRAAIAGERVRELKGLGARSEEKLARAIERLGSKQDRRPIGEALPLAEALLVELRALPQVLRADYCGSLRRFRETIADVDLLVAATEPAPIMDRFVSTSRVRQVLGHGDTKSSVVTDVGFQVDLRVVEPPQYGAALLYFTGSKQHNIELRQRALARGWTLNEYGLTELDGGAVIASETEADIYQALGLAFVPPPMREGRGEVEAAAEDRLPAAVTAEALRGDLHVHTDLSGDGRSSLGDIVAAAAARGYEYLAITDHGEDLALNGVSRERLAAQRAEIAAAAGRHEGLRVLHGCELNIGRDGALDYDAAFRASLEWCVAAVHSHFDLDAAAQTARLVRAIEDPTVDCIGHLSGRLIGRRAGIDFDVDAVLRAAARTETAIEINAALGRLDAAAEVLRRGADLGVLFVISTDAHHTRDLARSRFGALHGQRGWVDPERVANTWPLERFLAWRDARRARG